MLESWSIEDADKLMQPPEPKNLEPMEEEFTEPETQPTFEEIMEEEDLLFDNLSTLEQRFNNLDIQPRRNDQLRPFPVSLLTKRSKRCGECNKFIVKPEGAPGASTPFKMEFLLVYYLPRMYITHMNENEIHINFINPNTSVAYMEFTCQEFAPPSGEIHIDAYDTLVEMVTSEGFTEDESAVVNREKNMVKLRFDTGGVTEFILSMVWKFMRGAELKQLEQKIHIKL